MPNTMEKTLYLKPEHYKDVKKLMRRIEEEITGTGNFDINFEKLLALAKSSLDELKS